MPTYRNDSDGNINVHELLVLPPGETYETNRQLNISGLTEISADPQFNPVVQKDELTSGGGNDKQTVSVNSRADKIKIINKSSEEVYLYWNSDSNTPATVIPAEETEVFSDMYSLASSMVFEFPAAASAQEFYIIQEK